MLSWVIHLPGYRLVESDEGHRLRVDDPSEDDRVVREDGHVLFMVERTLDERLADIVIDVNDDDPDHPALELR